MQVYLEAFLPLFVAVNLMGVLPRYIGLTEGAPEPARRRLLIQAVATAFGVSILILFAVAFFFGPALLRKLGANTSKAIAKVASLFLAAIAVAMIRAGVVGMLNTL